MVDAWESKMRRRGEILSEAVIGDRAIAERPAISPAKVLAKRSTKATRAPLDA